MGRKKDVFWQHVDILDGKFKCKFCEREFAGGVSRIKCHLSGIKRKGIDTCNKVPEDVQSAASSAVQRVESSAVHDPNKRVRNNDATLSNLDENCVNSSLPVGSSRGPAKGCPLPITKDLVDDHFQEYMEEISEWLREEEVSIIGVWGMAGVGKTTLLKHIHNQVLEGFNGLSFDHVFWVPVRRDCSTRQLQKIIAKKIDLNISNEDDEMEIATMLSHGFKRLNKCLLILDDVWDRILLENVGIPPPTNNGVKMILTTRSFEVCQIMGCEKNIALEPICGEKAWVLFLKNLGSHAALPSEVTKIARSIAQECTGLPLAICTVAGSMKGKDEISEWRYLSEKLKSSMMGQEDMKKWVFPALGSSYDHLNDGKLQQCFLYCALYPERKRIKRNELIRNFIDEGFINGIKSLESLFDEGHIILKKLKNNSLLNEVRELDNFPSDLLFDIPKHVHSFSLQKLVWCMAVTIAEESHRYMAKGGQHLTEIPHERNWTEDLEKVSLMRNDIKEIPSGTSPRCPKLSTLLLQKNRKLKIIPEDFFINMPALRVLNLSETLIERLPEYLSDLESLVALVLSKCEYLSYIPSLEKLRELMRLDLSHSGIRELPQGLEMLINLRWLNLEGTEELEISSPSVIPQLTNLQSLFLWNHQLEVTAQEIQGLKMLESFSAHFHSREQFNACINLMLNKLSGFRNYYLQLGGYAVLPGPLNVFTDDKAVIIENHIISSEAIRLLLPMDIKRLNIRNCSMLGCLCDDFSTIGGNNEPRPLRYCQISSCRNLMCIFCSSPYCSFCGSLQSLDSLRLRYLDSLQVLHKFRFGALPIMGPFSSLRYFSVEGCNKIEYLLTPEMTAQLIHLKRLAVEFCYSMKQIFSADEEEDGNHSEIINISGITLPSLELVILDCLPKLTRVCIGVLTCESLQKFTITDCPRLEELPCLQPPFQIEVE